jgi:hypothetical protein
MANDINQLVEIMAEMRSEQRETNVKLRNVKSEVSDMKKELGIFNREMMKINLISAENNRAVVKLANQMEQFLDLDPRVRRLEAAVFK